MNMKFVRTWAMLALVLVIGLSVTGGTIAWFTDSVTSGNNIIQAGNLDVELYYQLQSQDGWNEVDTDTNLFKQDTLWEPGHTEVVKLKVVNAGSLALKYQLSANVASEVTSTSVLNKELKLSDYIKSGVIASDKDKTYTRDEAVAAVEASAQPLSTAYNSDVIELLPKTTTNSDNEDIVTMVVYMPTTVGNEANYRKGEPVPQIKLGIKLFATQQTAESDSFDNQYDANAQIASTATEAQAILDNAKPGTTIKLAPGVDYGTLYLRPVANGAQTKEVDWIGNNYRFETYSRFEDLTILGAEGATVDAIKIEGGTYYNTPHSQSDTYPIMLSLIELKNVTIDGVTFTGKGGYDPQGYGNVINLSGHIKVDGLTIKNCELRNPDNNARLLYKTESTTAQHKYTYDGTEYTFVPSLKDITVTGCTFNGGYMGLELRETENVTITNNEFNVGDRNILLPVNEGCTYTGNITITGNVSNFPKQRFVRASGTGSATVKIMNNTINGYAGPDPDPIKVSGADAGCVTTEPNTFNNSIFSIIAGMNSGDTLIVPAGTYTTTGTNTVPAGVTIKGVPGAEVIFQQLSDAQDDLFNCAGDVVFENVTFKSNRKGYAIAGNTKNHDTDGDITIINCKFNGLASEKNWGVYKNLNGNLTLQNCTFDNYNNAVCGVNNGNGSTTTITGCTFTNINGEAIGYVTSTLPADFESNVIANNTGLTAENVIGY